MTALLASSSEPTAEAAIWSAAKKSAASVGFGYVPERLPPAGPVGGPPPPACHASVGPVVTVSSLPTSPATGTGASQRSLAVFARVTFAAPIVGSGYVPARQPPAAPDGGRDVGAPVTFAYATPAIFASVTAPSFSFAVGIPFGASASFVP